MVSFVEVSKRNRRALKYRATENFREAGCVKRKFDGLVSEQTWVKCLDDTYGYVIATKLGANPDVLVFIPVYVCNNGDIWGHIRSRPFREFGKLSLVELIRNVEAIK